MGDKSKRVVAIADKHCGSLVGLTPPSWQLKSLKSGRRNKWVKIQSALWRQYEYMARRLRPVDLLIVNADCINGSGKFSGGTEEITTNREEQSEMAIECILLWHPRKVVITYGTAVHTGEQEDWEDIIARRVGAKIGSHEWIDVNGLVFDVKHHIGFSGVPHTVATPLLKDALWNELWSSPARNEQPHGDILLRAHVHTYCKVETATWCAISQPALQGMGSKYGSRRCSRTVDWGLLWWDVRSKADYDYHKELVRFDEQRARMMKI